MRIYVYTLRFDGGFSPNPFNGWCTLACCKPQIRKRAQPGDWVLGITPRALGNRLAYAMRVEESLPFEDYWADRRFRRKKPAWDSGGSALERSGDNCYQPLGKGRFRQWKSRHWDHENECEDLAHKDKDLGGQRVLVARRFAYFGEDACPLPEHLSFMIPARYSRVNFTPEQQELILGFLERVKPGLHARPRGWKDGDTSWRQRRAPCG